MSVTKNQLISDIELALNQGDISDDSTLDRRQIAFWINYELPLLIRTECDSLIQQGKAIPPIYVIRQTGIELDEEAVTEVEDKNQRMYFDLTGEVLDLYDDLGVVRVITDEQDFVHKISTKSIDMFLRLRFARPSAEVLTWHRVGNRFFIDGLQTADIEFNSFIVDYVEKQNILSLEDNDEVRVSDIILPELINRVVQRGKLQMYGSTPDVASDGVDIKNPAYHTQIASKQEQ